MRRAATSGVSGHFCREAKIMAGLFVVVVAGGLLVGLLLPRIRQWLAVDRCLDAGGSYNYQTVFARARGRVAKLPVRAGNTGRSTLLR